LTTALLLLLEQEMTETDRLIENCKLANCSRGVAKSGIKSRGWE